MTKQTLFGIFYVSILIIIWGSIGSLIDYPLLKASIYIEGSIGQLTTFIITGIIFTFIGVKSFPLIENYIIKTNK
tara:strand:+ start:1463 stop:1687 length:225 start_codon:yes stop_codon:yes gene_type:complete